MSRSAQTLAVVLSAGVLAGMLLTNPDYNSVMQPFVTRVAAGDTGQTRLFAAQITGWRTANAVEFTSLGRPMRRDTQGTFLIVDLTLTGTRVSTQVTADWLGASGRRYQATRRIAGFPREIGDVRVQPGLPAKATAIFELPADEVAGGRLALQLGLNPVLEGTLQLTPPPEAPAHDDMLRLP